MDFYLPNSDEVIVEGSVIERVQQRDTAAFEELYDQFAPVLTGVVMGILNEEESSDEVLQLTFLEIREGICDYEPSKGSFVMWMIKIARKNAASALGTKELSQNGKTPVTNGKKHIDAIPPVGKAVLNLVYFKGYFLSQASAELQIDVDTIKRIIRKELKNISHKKNG